MIKKILAILLVVMMLLPMVISCSKDKGDQTESDSVSADSSGEEQYDENGYLKDSLPELDYDDYEFKILAWDVYAARGDFHIETATGELVPDSIYKRNVAVQDRLNIKLQVDTISGNYDSQNDFVAQVLNISMAGGSHEYDLLGSYSMAAGTLAMNNLICDLYSLEYADFEKPWWSQSLIDGSELNGKLYFATGDLAHSYIYMLHFLAVNLDMIDSLDLEDPRELVKSGAWTLDKMIEMTKNVGAELDGVEGQSGGDRFGYAAYSGVDGDNWLAASNIHITDEDQNGVLMLSEEFAGQKTHDLLSKVNSWYWNSGDCYNKYDKTPILNGNTLFGGVAGELMYQMNEKTSYRYGILPYPKLSADQSGHSSLLGFAYTMFSIPNNAKDVDMSSAVLECMNSQAYRTSCPDLYEKVFKSRFATDPIDAEMFDMIRAGAYVDAARIFASSFGSVNSGPVGMFRSAVTGNKTDWMSNIGEHKTAVNNTLRSISAFIGG